MNNEQQAFCNDWKKNHDEDVSSIHMISLRGTQDDFLSMGFAPNARRKELWGLLIFGSKNLSFYIPASESSIMGMFRLTSGGKPPQDQLVVLSNFSPLTVISRAKKNLLRWLLEPSGDFLLTAVVNGKALQFSVLSYDKGTSVQDKIEAWLTEHSS